ncbi:MAG: hypothetical protein JNM72_02345 [Deltaproteobacteria bacterium]|nr:hypothetical protein [Deltaproteobacteria bacterium]
MHRVLLVVEGPHDLGLVHALLLRRGLRVVQQLDALDPELHCLVPREYPQGGDLLKRVSVPRFFGREGVVVVVAAAEGDTRLVATVAALQRPLNVDLNAVGVVLDADGAGAVARLDGLRRKWRATLGEALLPLATPGDVVPGPVRIGAFVLPDNESPGALEVLLRACATAEWPGALELADAFVLAAEPLLGASAAELQTPSKRTKAPISVLHALMRPGKAVQTSLEDGLWLGRAAFDAVPGLTAMDQFLWALVDPQPRATVP